MIPPQVIAALVGAAIGAGKTALSKNDRKKPMSWVSNVLGGAASGAAGGMGAGSTGAAAMGGLTSSLGGGGGFSPIGGNSQFSDDLLMDMDGNAQFDTPDGMPPSNIKLMGRAQATGPAEGFPELEGIDGGELPPMFTAGAKKEGGISPKAQLAADLLKSWIGRNKATEPAMAFPTVSAPSLAPVNFGYQAMPQMKVSPYEPLMQRRRY